MGQLIERELRYSLHPINGGSGYRAVVERDQASLDALPDICEELRFKESQLYGIVGSVLEMMAQKTLEDGMTRRFGDLFETRLDIRGKFTRNDEEFDPQKHSLVVNLIGLRGIRVPKRKEMPKNVVMRPHGIIESVSGPDGREGVVRFGEDIIVRGHDLEMGPYDSVCFDFYNRKGKMLTWVAALRDEGVILEHDDTHIRIGWSHMLPREELVGKEMTVRYSPLARPRRRSTKGTGLSGSRAKVRVEG